MLNKEQGSVRILIFRDKGKPGMRVAPELQKLAKVREFKLVSAADPAELRQKLECQSIAAVVIDVGREIGDTMTVLRLLKGFPAMPLFVFNSFMLPRIEEKIRGYDHVHYSESRDRLEEFITMILTAVLEKKPGTIQGISLPQFLQLMNNEKWSGQVMVMSAAEQGFMYLQEGSLVSAAAGELTGHEALDKMAAWKNISVETLTGRHPADLPIPNEHNPALTMKKADSIGQDEMPGSHEGGNIEFLHLIRQNRKIGLDLKKLNLGIGAVRDILSASLIRTDIFLSDSSRSLAGWNSHPLACSRFAAITRSLIDSLRVCGFPRLGAYYLLDLDDDQLLFIVVKDELQWGFLLRGAKKHLGLLLNIVLPRALKVLEDSLIVRNTF